MTDEDAVSGPTRVLLAVTGIKAGVRYPLPEGETLVGRSSASNIQLIDDAVSRHHAAFVVAGGRVEVRDLGGQNGTLVNGVRVDGAVAVSPRDVVTIGATTFVLDARIAYLPSPSGADVIVAEDVLTASSAARTVVGDESSPEAHEAAAALLEVLAGPDTDGEGVDLVGALLARVVELFGAARGFVARAVPGSPDRPKVVASVGQGPITVSRTVVREVLDGPTAVVSEDVASDAGLAPGLSLHAGGIRSLVAAPLVHGGRVMGLVHLDRAERGAFSPADLDRLLPHARVLALALLAQDGLTIRLRRARGRHRIQRPHVLAVAPATVRLFAEAVKAAASRANVLVTGPTGTGKEVIARVVHCDSDRRDAPFVAVNCGALPESLEESALFGHVRGAFTGADRDKEGLFEAAEGGTLFLDEVGETSRATQVKLLRALQERVITRVGDVRPRPVDVRVVAATHRRLEDLVAEGDFREDLYYRLAVIQLRVPPLADRPEDILPMGQDFLQTLCREAGVVAPTLSKDLEEALLRYGWPGNVRELRNTVERMVILAEGPVLDVDALPAELWMGPDAARRVMSTGDTLAEAVARLERELIVRTMARTGSVKSAVADALGISRVTLDAKLKAHAIPWSRRKGRSPPES